MKFFALLLSMCCAFCVVTTMPVCAVEMGEAVGRVTSCTRGAEIVRGGEYKNKPTPLKVGNKIYVGDVIAVDGEKGDGRLGVSMADGTSISLASPRGSFASFRIEEYRADGAEPSLKGTVFGLFRLITGKIAKINPEGTVIRTPHATVGIRGTDCVLHCIPVYFRTESASGYKSEATEVFVLHSAQPVLLNGTPIESGQKGKVGSHGGEPELGVVTPEERRKFNRLVPAGQRAGTHDEVESMFRDKN